MIKILCRIAILILMVLASTVSAEIYKFKDENGKWHFTDKKHAHIDSETVELKSSKKKRKDKPRVYVWSKKDKVKFVAVNPYDIPVQFRVTSKKLENPILKVIPPNSRKVIKMFAGVSERVRLKYRYVIGDPEIKPYDQYYYPPVPKNKAFKITQAFGGKFSHKSKVNYYAVDIAMPIGTPIHAARAGVVVMSKDDYHLGGTSNKKFFLDKSNFVIIVHEDGSYASYGHLLMGSVKVKKGERVEVGQVIAQSGTSGYSSGPHLHFVVRKNIGMKAGSLPFRFLSVDGKSYSPKSGVRIFGY